MSKIRVLWSNRKAHEQKLEFHDQTAMRLSKKHGSMSNRGGGE